MLLLADSTPSMLADCGWSVGEGKTMKLNRLAAIPAIALAAGLLLAACGSQAAPAPTVTVTAPVAAPAPTDTTAPNIEGLRASDILATDGYSLVQSYAVPFTENVETMGNITSGAFGASGSAARKHWRERFLPH